MSSFPPIYLDCSLCHHTQPLTELVKRQYKHRCKDTEACAERQLDLEPEIVDTTSKRKGYVVTSVLSDCFLHHAAYKATKTLADALGFELIIIPVAWGRLTEGAWVRYNDIYLNPHPLTLECDNRTVRLASDLNINANALAPLTGLAGIANDDHLIVPHPVRYLQTTASPVGELSKVMLTTGTISQFENHSTSTRIGAMTRFHSQLGCTIFTEGAYPVTPLPYCTTTESYTFEGRMYYADGSNSVMSTNPYIYLPDMHLAHPNLGYLNSLRDELRQTDCESAIGGDMFDGSSMLHHERDRLGYFAERMTIFQELDLLKRFIRSIGLYLPGKIYNIVGNHETFTDRFFVGDFSSTLAKFTKDEQVFLLRGFAYVLENTKHSEAGIKYASMYRYFIDSYLDEPNFEIAPRDVRVGKTLLGYHGHEWMLQKSGIHQSNYKVVAGHVHTPEISRNMVKVGYGGHPDPTYQSGLNKACAAHAFISPYGKITMRLWLPN